MKTPRGISALGTFLFFIVFLVALGFLWVSTGGPSRTMARSGPFLKPPTVPLVGVDGSIGGGKSSETDPDTNIPTLPDPKNSSSGNKPISLLDYFFNTRSGTGGGQATSPYASQIEILAGDAESGTPETEYIIIRTPRNLEKPITITGWILESKTKSIRVTIGSAASIPISGQINNDYPITLGPSSTVYITTGRSPSGGSFRTNMCTGYFEQFQDYTPRLKTECPDPEDEALKNPQKTAGSIECVDFIDNLRACELYTDTVPNSAGSLCQNFVQNDLTYNGCVAAHRNDPDFYRNDWRVFLNRQQELWVNSHDQIRLLDENGQLIASISY